MECSYLLCEYVDVWPGRSLRRPGDGARDWAVDPRAMISSTQS
jgi:hypothetical protein